MLVTKDLDNKVFDYIDLLGETLSFISQAIRDSYHRTIMGTPCQVVFGRDMLFNLASVLDQKAETASKNRQVDIYNFRENSKQVTHEQEIGDQVYVEMTGIYHKIDYNKQEPYRSTEVFTNGTV